MFIMELGEYLGLFRHQGLKRIRKRPEREKDASRRLVRRVRIELRRARFQEHKYRTARHAPQIGGWAAG